MGRVSPVEFVGKCIGEDMKKNQKQKEQVRNHLKQYGSLTSWDAILNWRLTRLSQYILLLRQEGYEIISEWQHNAERRWVIRCTK